SFGSHRRGPVGDAVVGNSIGFWRNAITAEAVRPVICFYPPLYLGVYFFKRALSLHSAPTHHHSLAASVLKQVTQAFITSFLKRKLHHACHGMRPVNAALGCPAVAVMSYFLIGLRMRQR